MILMKNSGSVLQSRINLCGFVNCLISIVHYDFVTIRFKKLFGILCRFEDMHLDSSERAVFLFSSGLYSCLSMFNLS